MVQVNKKKEKMENLKQKTLINFKKAQSHITKIINMLNKNEYCINVIQQNLAVIGLLRSAHQMLMENHLNTYFKTAMGTKNEKRKKEMTQEVLKVTKLFNRRHSIPYHRLVSQSHLGSGSHGFFFGKRGFKQLVNEKI